MACQGAAGRDSVLELFTYPPVLRGFILLLISGFTFPLGGVFILRMNILPIRYLLMHGVLLGGALGLAFDLSPQLTSFAVNLLLIIILNRSSGALGTGYGHLSMFFMVAAVAGASIITSVFHVPAKDTLTLLWGSLYSSTPFSVVSAAVIGGGIVLFAVIFFNRLTAVFYDREVASSLGINVSMFELAVMLITSLVVASAMQLMGALLLDAQIILPVVIAGLIASGLRQTMLIASTAGGVFSILGFMISIFFDLPASAGVAIPAVFVFIITVIVKKRRPNS